MENTREITDLEKLKIEAFENFIAREHAMLALEKANANLSHLTSQINRIENENSDNNG